MRAAACAFIGLLAFVTMPVAVLATRYFARYELKHAGLAIPLALVLALTAFSLARSAKGFDARRLGRAGGTGVARAGRLLGWGAIWLAGAAGAALAVWGLLEYQASR